MVCGPLAQAVEVWVPRTPPLEVPEGAAALKKRVAALEGARSKLTEDAAQQEEQEAENVDPAILELDNMLAILDDVEVAGVDMPGIGDRLVQASFYLLVCPCVCVCVCVCVC